MVKSLFQNASDLEDWQSILMTCRAQNSVIPVLEASLVLQAFVPQIISDIISSRKRLAMKKLIQTFGYEQTLSRSPSPPPKDGEAKADGIREVKDRQLQKLERQNKNHVL